MAHARASHCAPLKRRTALSNASRAGAQTTRAPKHFARMEHALARARARACHNARRFNAAPCNRSHHCATG
eukprot:11176891-Lingulodinium_polyedra.AAC.1